MSLGPFDLTGGPFLNLYDALLFAAVVISLLLPRWLRSKGKRIDAASQEEWAYLSGGKPRYASAIVADMLSQQKVKMVGRDTFVPVQRAKAASAAEAAVLALSAPVRWKDIERALQIHSGPVQRKLISAGLIMTRRRIAQMRIHQTLPFLLVMAFGSIKWVIGSERGKPVGDLTGLLVLTLILAAIRWATYEPATRGGIAILRRARARSRWLKRAPTQSEAGLAVALFGTAVLAGSGIAAFHRLRASTSGGDAGDGGGCGGCGGGCGGCGG